jgi:prevent-host-death family protein
MGEKAIDLGEAQANLAELVREAVRDEEVILTDGGEPVAKIIPFKRPRIRRQFGCAGGLIHISDDFDAPLEDFRDYV